MKKAFGKLYSEEGTSFIEVMIVSVILIFVLAAVWNLNSVISYEYTADKMSSDSVLSASSPLWGMDRIVSQNIMLETYTSYALTVLTDTNLDALPERTIYSYNSGTHTLSYVTWNTSTARINTTRKSSGVVSTQLWNGYYGTPIFVYYDSAGVQITDTSKTQSDTRSVKVQFRISNDAGKTDYANSRTILFRNRGI